MRAVKGAVAVGVVLLATASPVLAQAGDHEAGTPVSVTFYHTTDLHEHGEPLPAIAGFVESRRNDDPNVLFVDSGDWFDGGELTELDTRGEAITAMLGASGYDAMIPGNADYSFGTERLAGLIDRFALPVVAANVVWPEKLEPEHAVPYRIFELDGVTVAVIGVATSHEADELLEFLPTEESIGEVVAMLEDRADITTLLTHQSKFKDRLLAEALPGVDIIFGGHDHVAIDDVFIPVGTDTIIQHSGSAGFFVGELTVVWDGERIVEPDVRLIWVADELPKSVGVDAIYQEYLSQTPTPVE